MSEPTKEQQALLAIAHHVEGLAAECGKSGHKVVGVVEDLLGLSEPVTVQPPPESPAAEVVVSQHPLDDEVQEVVASETKPS